MQSSPGINEKISVASVRYEPNGSLCSDMGSRSETVIDAVVSLLKYELGFGGTITDVSDTTLTIRTPLFGRYDVVRFSGTQQAMLYLIHATKMFYELSSRMRSVLIDKWFPATKGNALLVTKVLPVMIGGDVAKATLVLLAAGEDAAAATALAGLSLNDVIDCIKIANETESDAVSVARTYGLLA